MNDVNHIIIGNGAATTEFKIKKINEVFEYFSNFFIMTHGLFIGVLIGCGIIMTFKIAGPIYRMKKYFNEVDPAELSEMKLRKNDMLHDLADVYNKNIDKFKNKENKE